MPGHAPPNFCNSVRMADVSFHSNWAISEQVGLYWHLYNPSITTFLWRILQNHYLPSFYLLLDCFPYLICALILIVQYYYW